MEILANVLVGLVAALHMYILVMEMFLWEKKPGRGLHGFEPELARPPRRWPPTRVSTTAFWRPVWCGG